MLFNTMSEREIDNLISVKDQLVNDLYMMSDENEMDLYDFTLSIGSLFQGFFMLYSSHLEDGIVKEYNKGLFIMSYYSNEVETDMDDIEQYSEIAMTFMFQYQVAKRNNVDFMDYITSDFYELVKGLVPRINRREFKNLINVLSGIYEKIPQVDEFFNDLYS